LTKEIAKGSKAMKENYQSVMGLTQKKTGENPFLKKKKIVYNYLKRV
jgi:hypothetical protein